MRIFLIGVWHFDPLGAEKVQRALLLAQKDGFIPDCIAVEWRSSYAEAVIAQRNIFAQQMFSRFPSLSSHELEVLKSSLAFEADAHKKIYPSIPILIYTIYFI